MADHSSQIVEFLLRQPIPDSLLNQILLFLPLPSTLSPRLTKALLLRRIASELSRGPSDQTLHSLELIHSLDRSNPSVAMRAAYCAVAVDATARTLRVGDEGDFFDAVNRIWNCRVGDLERSEAARLVSGRLREERRVMGKAVVDVRVREGVRERETEREAVEKVRAYLKEAAEELGPSFLELAVEDFVEKRNLEGRSEVSMRGGGNSVADEGGCSTRGADQMPLPKLVEQMKDRGGRSEVSMPGGGNSVSDKGGCSTSGADQMPLPKLVEQMKDHEGRSEVSLTGGGRGLSNGGCSTSRGNSMPLHKVIKIKEEPKFRSHKPQGNVEECCLVPVRMAARTWTAGTKEPANPEIMDGIKSRIGMNPISSADNGTKIVHTGHVDAGTRHSADHGAVLQPSLAEKNKFELKDAGGNQNRVGVNAPVSKVDMTAITVPIEGASTSMDHDVALQPILAGQNKCDLKDVVGNQNRVAVNAPVSTVDKGTIAVSTEGTSTSLGRNLNSTAVPLCSIMERNPTARTYEWHDDSISSESLSEESSELSEKLQFPRTRKREVHAVRVGDRKVIGQRKKKKWSLLEEETLRKAVAKYGAGHWTFIKGCHAEVFEDRTAGDLKDKWRNMTNTHL